MGFKGAVEVNEGVLKELFDAVVNKLANNNSRLAVWLLQNEKIDLSPLKPHLIGAESPLKGSNSVLAGSGLLIKLDKSNAQKIIQLFSADDLLECEVLHIEIESKNSVQFASYDHFEHTFFGDEIPISILEALKIRGAIHSYQVF